MADGGFVSHGNAKNYEGKVTGFVIITCLVAATGGLLFGYDIGISGKFFFFFYLKLWLSLDNPSEITGFRQI